MSYVVDTINFPNAMSGAPSCKDQHALYDLEKIRVSALAAQLGVEAKQCHKLHGEYDAAFAANAAAAEERARCQQAMGTYQGLFSSYSAALAAKQACDAQKTSYSAAVSKYKKAQQDYAAIVERNNTANANKRKAFDAALAKAHQENILIGQQNAAAAALYKDQIAAWKYRTTKFQEYKAAVAKEADALYMAWKIKTPKTIQDTYQFNHTTGRCGVSMRCQTKAWYQSQASKCIVLKGLGATLKPADACMVRYYYPMCPDTCPPAVADPGPAPKEPVPLAAKPYPTGLVLTSVISFDDYLKQTGTPVPGGAPTCNPSVPAAPTKPNCNPDAQLPSVPSKPTCTAPAIPAMPVAPTCKPTVTSQMGTMWLVLAVGAGGLYWYSKKK